MYVKNAMSFTGLTIECIHANVTIVLNLTGKCVYVHPVGAKDCTLCRS